jgi:predicted metal-dependent phosphoesterase TrpH
MSVTDHDTRASEPEARVAAAGLGMSFIPGIELTAVSRGRTMHLLAYGLPRQAPTLDVLIARQQELRAERAREIAKRLDQLGAPIDIEALLSTAAKMPGHALARPQIAQSLVQAGHVRSTAEAFQRYLDEGAGAFVPHTSVPPEEMIEVVRRSGGVTSLAHPGQLRQDDVIPGLVDAGLSCIEVYHCSHSAEVRSHYLEVAAQYGLAVTGGSDFHGDEGRYAECLGHVSLPAEHYAAFEALLAGTAPAVTIDNSFRGPAANS